MGKDLDRLRASMGDEPPPLAAPTTMRWLFGRYPHVDVETMRSRLVRYGVSERDQHYESLLKQYHRLRDRQSFEKPFWLIVVLVLGVVPMVVKVAIGYGRNPLLAALVGEGRYSWLWWIPVGVFVAFFAGYSIHTRITLPGVWQLSRGPESIARHRFFRAAGLAFESGYHVVVTQNVIGLAARALFLSLQRRRWTWASPPAVADRALRLTRPLLDIAVDDSPAADGQAVFSFLYDVVLLVIAGREDLIPAVRDEYAMLPHRSAGEETDERDVHYLDPMRHRGRWEVVKDFVLPLASWISLLVSIAALLVAAGR